MPRTIRYLLFQARNPDDPMRVHEIQSFARALGCARAQIDPMNFLAERPSRARLQKTDMVLIGGSGDYSAVTGGPWLESVLDTIRELYVTGKPTFGSCWGFQAIALALGGKVETNPVHAEIGALQLHLSEEGMRDPVFGPVGSPFLAHCGHQDTVMRMPVDAVWLAFSERTRNQALKMKDAPMYGTQFHPELRLADIHMRFERYPEYVTRIADVPFDDLRRTLAETPETNKLLRRFVRLVFGD